jgi:hypothetical protein
VGILGAYSALNLTGVTINNCYSTTNIEIHNTAASMSVERSAGGLVGKIRQVGTSAGTLTINNCIALNPKAISGDTTLASYTYSNRVIGYNERTNVAPTLNTYALKGMLVGTTDAGTADNSDGLATDVVGEGKTADTETGGLLKAATWAALGFSTDVWDFSPLTAQVPGWPTLK